MLKLYLGSAEFKVRFSGIRVISLQNNATDTVCHYFVRKIFNTN